MVHLEQMIAFVCMACGYKYSFVVKKIAEGEAEGHKALEVLLSMVHPSNHEASND